MEAIQVSRVGIAERILALPNCIDLLLREVVETPVGLVHGDPEGLPMAAVVVFSELRDCDALFVILNRVPQSTSISRVARCI